MSISKKLREIADELEEYNCWKETAQGKFYTNFWVEYGKKANEWLPEWLKPHFLTWLSKTIYRQNTYERDYHQAIKEFYQEFCKEENDKA